MRAQPGSTARDDERHDEEERVRDVWEGEQVEEAGREGDDHDRAGGRDGGRRPVAITRRGPPGARYGTRRQEREVGEEPDDAHADDQTEILVVENAVGQRVEALVATSEQRVRDDVRACTPS